jgi:PAS domain S-box-containing protein
LSITQFLAGGGTMGACIQAYDWSTSRLGPIETWPQPLRSALRTALRSKFPTYLAWGPERISFYNDAYLPLLEGKPDALGRPIQEVWPEIWDILGPITERAFQGEASYFEDMPRTIERHGSPTATWWTFSYSPLEDETGRVEGMLAIGHETTHRVLMERRLQFLVDLGNRLRGLTDSREVRATAAEMLGRYLRASRVGYAEIDSDGTSFTVERDWTDGTIASFAGQYRVDDFGPWISSELKAGRTIRIDDALADPRTAEEAIAAEFIKTGTPATLIVPLIDSGRWTASLYVHHAEPHQWREDEVTLTQDVAERTWSAILRARAETALRQSEARFRQFAEHSTDVLWIVDAATMQMEYVGPAFERVWGQSLDAVQTRSQWIETIHPEDRGRAFQANESVLRGETVAKEYRIIRPDGTMRYIQATVFPIFDEHGRVQRIGGVARDVTQHDGSMVYVVDGNEASRRELSLVLQEAGFQVNQFSSAQAFLEVAPVLLPGCVVLDARAPEAGGLAIPKELKARRAGLPVIVLGEAHGNVAVGVEAMKAGAVDFLSAPYSPAQLLEALASAQAGIHEQAERSRDAKHAAAAIASLSAREREVLDGLLAGGTNKTIARDLDISPRTVETHRARIMERLGAHSLPELVQIAVAAGLQTKPQDGRS